MSDMDDLNRSSLIAEIKRLQSRYDIVWKQLDMTRKWVTKQQKVLYEMQYQARHVSCSAFDIDEWVGDD